MRKTKYAAISVVVVMIVAVVLPLTAIAQDDPAEYAPVCDEETQDCSTEDPVLTPVEDPTEGVLPDSPSQGDTTAPPAQAGVLADTPPQPQSASLPDTGLETGVLLWLAGGLLLAGLGIFAITRKRA